MTKRLMILFLIVASAPAAAAQTSWSTHTQTGEYAFARGDFARAEREFQAALELAKAFPEGDTRLETSLFNLGRFYEHRSDYDRAQPLYQLLLAAREHRLGPEDPALLEVLFAVARVSQPSGDIPSVISSLRRYAAIVESSGAGDPSKHWQALQMLARLERTAGIETQAIAWQRMAAEMISRDPSATDEERANVLESTANFEITDGRGEAAAGLLEEAARLRIADGQATSIAETLNRGAATAFGAGRFETADLLAERALADGPDQAAEIEALKILAEISWARVNRGTDDLEILLAGAQDDEELKTASERLQSLNQARNGQDIGTMRRLVQVEALRGLPASAAMWQGRVIEAGSSEGAAMVGDRADLVVLLANAGEATEALAENAVAIAAAADRFGESSPQVVALLEQRVAVATAAGEKKEAKKAKKMLKKLR